jgi:hypothetical protein
MQISNNEILLKVGKMEKSFVGSKRFFQGTYNTCNIIQLND